MSMLVDGTSVITGGLDYWHRGRNADLSSYKEFEVSDWRLQQRLNVQTFRLPPDYRTPQSQNKEVPNTGLTVPVLRFPRWHFCMFCKRLERSTLSMTDWVLCPDDSHEKKDKKKNNRYRMAQVPFMTICAAGHLDDFPFSEWVHRSLKPACKGPLRLKSQ